MENLKELFNKRDSVFEAATLEIFKKINTTLTCVTTFLNEIDPMVNAGKIVWEDSSLHEDDDLITIVGMVEFTPGTSVEIDGETIEVTEETVEYLNRVIHMSLPYDLVEADNGQEITSFLQDIHAEEMERNMLESSDDEDNIPTQQTGPDFDLTKLTEEQRQALDLYNAREKN